MRFVKIGDAYFNPMRISCINADLTMESGKYRPIVTVCADGISTNYDAELLGLSAPDCEEQWAALGFADAMAQVVVEKANEALA